MFSRKERASPVYTIIINKERIFITNRPQNYFAMINRNHNRDRTNANAILSKEQVGWNHVKQLFLNPWSLPSLSTPRVSQGTWYVICRYHFMGWKKYNHLLSYNSYRSIQKKAMRGAQYISSTRIGIHPTNNSCDSFSCVSHPHLLTHGYARHGTIVKIVII